MDTLGLYEQKGHKVCLGTRLSLVVDGFISMKMCTKSAKFDIAMGCSTKGVSWHPRFAVLSSTYLYFSKIGDVSREVKYGPSYMMARPRVDTVM